jgi:hypothetical protein
MGASAVMRIKHPVHAEQKYDQQKRHDAAHRRAPTGWVAQSRRYSGQRLSLGEGGRVSDQDRRNWNFAREFQGGV